jgi:hypothetical protein
MAKFTELSSIKFKFEKDITARLCLDSVLCDDGETGHAIVWRGTTTSPDGFVALPAIFSWEDLGKLIRKALQDKTITLQHLQELLSGLYPKEPESY